MTKEKPDPFAGLDSDPLAELLGREATPSVRCPYCGFGVGDLAMHINAKHPEKAA